MSTVTKSYIERVNAVDFLRGLVMVLMAIDHVRVYAGVPPGGPDPAIFFTRWVTHFCAPAFVFLSGTSAFLYWQRNGQDTGKLRKYLLTRGALLILLELTFIRFTWTFNFNYSQFTLAGVIWMIGWCMVLLGLMVQWKPRTIGIIGLLIVFFQNAFALVPGFLPESAREPFGLFWEFIYSSGLQGPSWITILYVIVPWIGVMAAGYGFGLVLQLPEAERNKWLIRIGFTATLAFILAGSIFVLMNKRENAPPFLFQLLGQRKYPASQLFLLMTLGPSILAMPWMEKSKGWFSNVMITFGRVPFFYYLVHIPLIHITSLLVMGWLHGTMTIEGYSTAPYAQVAPELRWSLSTLYLVLLIDVMILYVVCRWYLNYKRSHPEVTVLKYI